jgi:ATP-binding protein involved in chromosome partitioning
MMETAALRELLSDTTWGKLDYLLVDLPPGTDKLPNLVDLFPQLAGTIVVTIPSGVSQFVVGKSISMAHNVLKTPVIGLVENMSAYICTHCGKEESLFPTGRVEQWAADHEVPFLGSIPFDPRLAAAADAGTLFMQEHAALPAGQAIQQLADQVKAFTDF